MTYTLRQLTTAFSTAHPSSYHKDGDELEKVIHVRGRNLRDKGLVRPNYENAPGDYTFSDEDVAAACVALAINLAGLPWAYIDAMNYWLRPTSSATRPDRRPMAFHESIEDIKAGRPCFLTITWSFPADEARAFTHATMGKEPSTSVDPNVSIVVPVTAVAKPVFDALERAAS